MVLHTEDIVRLLQLKGMGRRTAKRFCELDSMVHGRDLIDFILEVSSGKLLSRFPEYSRAEIETAFAKGEEILEKSERADIKITSYFDRLFPTALKNIPDPPLVISTKGKLAELTAMDGVAVIGTRQPNAAGVKAGEHFGKQLALRGYNVVSGLAIGCDAAGHRGCLAANGVTTAILAHGLHTIYPKENKLLAEEILEKGGLLLSEYFMGTGALANFFVERDRLQAGLSVATIVVQTAEKGGTMHAVNATLASGKKLAAIKYKGTELTFEKTRGNEKLIQEGKAFALTSDNFDEFLYSLSKDRTLSPTIEQTIPHLPALAQLRQPERQAGQPQEPDLPTSLHEGPAHLTEPLTMPNPANPKTEKLILQSTNTASKEEKKTGSGKKKAKKDTKQHHDINQSKLF